MGSRWLGSLFLPAASISSIRCGSQVLTTCTLQSRRPSDGAGCMRSGAPSAEARRANSIRCFPPRSVTGVSRGVFLSGDLLRCSWPALRATTGWAITFSGDLESRQSAFTDTPLLGPSAPIRGRPPWTQARCAGSRNRFWLLRPAGEPDVELKSVRRFGLAGGVLLGVEEKLATAKLHCNSKR